MRCEQGFKMTKRVRLAAAIVTISLSATACVLPLRAAATAGADAEPSADQGIDRPIVDTSAPTPAPAPAPAPPTPEPGTAAPTTESDDFLDTLVALDEAVTNREAISTADAGSNVAGGPFIVGDSTMVEAVNITGIGSAVAGLGFTPEAIHGQNPLALPEADYEGPVVMGVSVWDMWSTDLSGYTDATEQYRAQGHDVIWVGVPPTGGEFKDGAENPLLVALNESVEEILGCDLVAWNIRFVEYADGIHPTVAGANDIVASASALTAADVCQPGIAS